MDKFSEILLNKKRYNQKGPSIYVIEWRKDYIFDADIKEDITDELFVVKVDPSDWRYDGLVMYEHIIKLNGFWHSFRFNDVFETYDDCLEYIKSNNVRINFFKEQYGEVEMSYKQALGWLKYEEHRLNICEKQLKS